MDGGSGETAAHTTGTTLRQNRSAQYEEAKESVRAHGYDLTGLKMRDLKPGETCAVERRYVERGGFSFTAGERVESAGDVAFLFRELEDAAVENSFMVLLKDGEPTVVHLAIGSYNAVHAPLEQAFVAAQAINPDKVIFVHNHPSGSLHASLQDRDLQQKVETIFGEKAAPGIIIDTKSGKYALFSGEYTFEYTRPESVEQEVPVKVFSFSKQVFAPDWNPESAFRLGSPDDMAAFVSSHRLGEHPKMSLLVLNVQHQVVGNIFLPWTNLEDACKADSVMQIATAVNQMGGIRAVVYGNFAMGKETDKLMSGLNLNLKGYNVGLLDVLNVAGDSAHNRGVMEPDVVYGRDEARDDSVRNISSGIEALRKIAAGEESVPKAMTRNDLTQYGGDNEITFYYGKTGNPENNFRGGYGIAHIGGKHGADTLLSVLNVIANGKIDRYVAGNKTVVLSDGQYEAVLALTRFGDKETWLFNGWKKDEGTGADGEVSTHSDATQANPTFSREDLGAVLSDAKIQKISEIAKKSAEKMQVTGKHVYQGSSAAFDRFDHSKVGSGEGQAVSDADIEKVNGDIQAAIIKLMPSESGDYYNVETAGYYRKSKWKDSEEVIADLSEPSQSAAATDASEPQVPYENGGERINAETQELSSEGKDTKNFGNDQEKTEKSAIQRRDDRVQAAVVEHRTKRCICGCKGTNFSANHNR